MQLKFTAYVLLFAILVCPMKGKSLHRRGCYECEEEVWEEVPCDDIPANVTKVTTASPKQITSQTIKPALSTLSTPSPPKTSYSTTVRPEFTTPKDPYKKCYYECKLGCKEFCRKVVINPANKQIVQVSKISEPAGNGRIQQTHILQRELIPEADQVYDNKENYIPSVTRSNIPSEKYFPKSVMASVEPFYGSYAVAEADVSNLQSYPSYNNPPNSDHYDFSIPFDKVFSKVSKAASVNPLDAPKRKLGSPLLWPYSSPTPVNDAALEARTPFEHLDDSFDSFIMKFIDNNPTNIAPNRYIPSVSNQRRVKDNSFS